MLETRPETKIPQTRQRIINGSADRPLGELFSELATETSALIREQIELARVELSNKAQEAVRNVIVIGVGGAVAYGGFLAIVAGAILLLGMYIPVWLSALLIGVVIAGTGYGLVHSRLSAFKHWDPTPRVTLETLRADRDWAKEQIR